MPKLPATINLIESEPCFLKHIESDSVFSFSYFHSGFNQTGKRVMFERIKSKNYQGPLDIPNINDTTYITVNSQDENHKFTFKLNICKETAKLMIDTFPVVGLDFIPQEGINGFEIKL